MTPVTTAEQAKEIACAFLAKKKWPHEKYLGAVRTSEVDPSLLPKNAEDLWIVYFEPKIRPDVLRIRPASSIAIFVYAQTGNAEHIPSL